LAEVREIEPLSLTEQERTTYPMYMVHIYDKLNELIDAFNQHYHGTPVDYMGTYYSGRPNTKFYDDQRTDTSRSCKTG